MNEYFFQHITPRLDYLDARLKKVEATQKALPLLEISIESANCDDLILQLQKLYQNFSGGCNLNIKVNLKENEQCEH